MNFQDVIRDVHDPTTHSLQTSGGGATVFAVVNTAAAGDTVNNIGFATVSVSNPTLYAVVNTGAVGVGNSIVTINPRTDYLGLMSVSGNVNVGLPTVTVGNETLYAVVNTAAAGQASVVLDSGVNNIGFATVSVSNPTLYAVVNTATVGVSNSMVTINPRTDYFGLVSVSGNVAVSSLPATPVGTNFIGLATVWNANQQALVASTVNIGSVSVLGGTIAVSSLPALAASSAFVGLVTVANTVTVGAHALSAGVAGIGFATVSLGAGNSNIGDVDVASIAAGANYIGLVTAVNGLAWPDPKTYVGLVTVGHTITVAAHALTASTVNIGSVSVLGGTIKLDTNTLNIGSVSVLGGTIGATLAASSAFVGIVTIANQPVLPVGTNFVGLVTVAPHSLTASTLNIGSVSVLGGGIGLNAGVNNIGFATVTLSAGMATVTLGTRIASTTDSIDTRNGGTMKTLINIPIGFSAASVVTVAVPTNVNSVKITNMLLNSDATVRFTMKSGVTYLTGNASIGITLNPGGGFIMTGSPDSPSWIGLPSGALVIEKFDTTATAAKIAGNVVYFQD